MNHAEIHWKVTWFPPEAPDVVRSGSEEYVRGLAKNHAEWHPVVEWREVVVGPWRMEE